MRKGFTPLFIPLILFLIVSGIITMFLVKQLPTPEESHELNIKKEERKQRELAKKIQDNDNLTGSNPDASKIKDIVGILEKSKNIEYVSYTLKSNYTSSNNKTEEEESKRRYHDNKIRTDSTGVNPLTIMTPEKTFYTNSSTNQKYTKDTPALFKTSYFDREYGYIILILTKYLDVKVNKLDLDQNTNGYDIIFEYTDNSVIDFPEKGSYELKVLENGFCIYQKKIISTGITINQATDYSFEPFSDKLFEIPN